MKNTVKYMGVAMCLASLASCSSSDEPTIDNNGEHNPVQLEATISAKDIFGRSNPVESGDLQGKFNNGDAIALSQKQGETFGDAVKYTLSDNVWTPAGTMIFDHFPTTFRAVYPGDASYDKFDLPTDQTTAEQIAAADYMRKELSLEAEPEGSKLSLAMERQMARIVVELTNIDPNCGGIKTFEVVSSYAGFPAENAVATAVNAYKSDNVYYALIVPGAASTAEDFLVLTTGNGRTLRVTGIPETAAGYSYSFKAAVDAQQIMIIGEPVVTPWTDGGVIDGNVETITYFDGGNGTEAAPYLISNAAQLDNMHKVITNEEGAAGEYHFRLTADIDMTGITEWSPLNNKGNVIYFDGDGHTISNFSCSQTNNPSFFGVLLGKVSKVRFVNAYIENNETGIAGILTAYLSNGAHVPALVEQVSIQGSIKVTKPGSGSDNIDPVGAFAGRVYKGTITNCYANVTIDRISAWGNVGVGGIAGDISNGAVITNCWATGNIKARKSDNTKENNAGSIVGRGLNWNGEKWTVDKCIGWMTEIYAGGASGRVMGRTWINFGNYGTNHAWKDMNMNGADYRDSLQPTNDNAARDGIDSNNIIESAKTLGWDESVWNLAGETPRFVWEK